MLLVFMGDVLVALVKDLKDIIRNAETIDLYLISPRNNEFALKSYQERHMFCSNTKQRRFQFIQVNLWGMRRIAKLIIVIMKSSMGQQQITQFHQY